MSDGVKVADHDGKAMKEIALVTQMRAGTHYLCLALRLALEATIYRPNRERRYILMEDDYILRGLHAESQIRLPEPNPDLKIYFNHYYHPQLHTLPGVPRINLIGYPFDSFYSDGVVYSKPSYDVGPSGPRAHQYIFRADSHEWNFLEEKMRENATWLEELKEGDDDIIIRYEDLFHDFDGCVRRLSQFVGGFINPIPQPIRNPKRMYWTDDYASALDQPALTSLWQLFEPGVRRFYPEKVEALLAAL
jgi:hypothetical protein